MDTSQVILYAVLALFLLWYIKRMLTLRKITRYAPAEASAKAKSNTALLLDVRTPAERSSSSIKGSLHIPLHELRRRSSELEKHKSKEIICYCATGSRSLSAAATLSKLGFKAANLKGGIAEWNFSGMK